MFSPYVVIAEVLIYFASVTMFFGIGWHYGDKGKIAITKYEAVVTEKTKLKVDLDKARSDYADAKAALVSQAGDAGVRLRVKETQIDNAEAQQKADAAKYQVAVADLATARLMLGDATDENRRRADAAVAAASNGTAQSANLAGRLDSCESTARAIVTASRVNNAELKRAIERRDTCVELYNGARTKLNGVSK